MPYAGWFGNPGCSGYVGAQKVWVRSVASVGRSVNDIRLLTFA
jgi:hypothetical protein